MYTCPNVQMSKYPNVHMSKCPNVQMSTCTHRHIYTYTHIHIHTCTLDLSPFHFAPCTMPPDHLTPCLHVTHLPTCYSFNWGGVVSLTSEKSKIADILTHGARRTQIWKAFWRYCIVICAQMNSETNSKPKDDLKFQIRRLSGAANRFWGSKSLASGSQMAPNSTPQPASP